MTLSRLLSRFLWGLALLLSLTACQVGSLTPATTVPLITTASTSPSAPGLTSLTATFTPPPTVTPLEQTYTPTPKSSAKRKLSATQPPTSTRRAIPPTQPNTPTLEPSPTFIPSPTRCLSLHGNVTQKSFESALIHKTVDYRVYEPPCYDPQANPRYPALYLLHGIGYDVTQWSRLGAAEAADELITSGEAPPFLMVMPLETYTLQDFATSPFREMVINELIPLIDQDYATCTARRCRAVGGISRGALWAMLLGFKNWQIFGSAGGHSLPGSPLVVGEILDLQRQMSPEPPPRIYLDAGQEDISLPSARDFDALLKRTKMAHEFHIFPGMHNEDYWGAHVLDYLRWYSRAWKE